MTILLVDDDRNIRTLERAALQDLPGVEFVEAEDGFEAWNRLEAGLHPDLCVVDMMMPRMDGMELLQKIRGSSSLRSLKVMICSVVNERFRMAEAMSMDIVGYLVKPFTPAKLVEEVRRILRPHGGVDPNSAHAEERCRMIIGFFAQKYRQVADDTEQTIAQLRASLAMGDRRAAESHLARIQAAARKEGFFRLAGSAAKLEDKIYLESESLLFQGVDLIAGECRKLAQALVKLEDPKVRRDLKTEPPSAVLLHQRFVAAFELA